MSRPKGSKNKPKDYDFTIQKEIPPIYICDKCNKPIYYQYKTINTNYLTGISYWHRQMPEKITICQECAEELSEMLDSWFGKSRFDMKGKENDTIKSN